MQKSARYRSRIRFLIVAVALIIFTSCQRKISEATLRRDFRAENPSFIIVSISDAKGDAARSKVQISYQVPEKETIYIDTWNLEHTGYWRVVSKERDSRR